MGGSGRFSPPERVLNMPYPHDFVVADVYLPPTLVAAGLGLLATLMTTRLMNRYGVSRHFANPPLAFISMLVLYTVLIGTLFFGL